jgi:hypothetical protein
MTTEDQSHVDPVLGGHVWIASGISIVLLLFATWALFGFNRALLLRLVIGADNRASTSKFQATVWTYALLFALLALLVGHLVYADFDAGWDKFLKDGLNSDYLWLLGVPSVGLVGAKAITQSKAQANPSAKPTKRDENEQDEKGADQKDADVKGADKKQPDEDTGEKQSGDKLAGGDTKPKNGLLVRTRELASDDNDRDPQPALGDLQYLVFNAIAVAYFLSAFLGHVERGLPSLPDTLIALTGVSAASYLSAKAVKSAAPAVIVSVRPSRVVLGPAAKDLEVSGGGFLGATGKGVKPAATLDGVDLTVMDGATAEHLTAVVPTATEAATEGLKAGKLPLVIFTPDGQKSAPETIEVLEPPK